MTFDRLNRRTHLYLAMFLMPWFFMYGLSSIPFSHSAFFNDTYNDGTPDWIPLSEREYHLPLPAEQNNDQEIGAQILKEAGIEGVAYGTYRPNPRIIYVYMPNFLRARQVTYSADENKLVLQDRRFRWDHLLTGMHARGGFQHDLFLDDAWAVTVDIVMIAILLWIASGVYMWWHVPGVRFWGVVALGGGWISFVLLVFAM